MPGNRKAKKQIKNTGTISSESSFLKAYEMKFSSKKLPVSGNGNALQPANINK
jgi:hypothetical protein